jgi:pimeloyl-ACP methyl ester carboxylesterase
MRRERVAIGGKQISYLLSDTPPPAVRQHPLRTVVFLHAFPLQAAMWQTALGSLPEGWRGLAPDFRGFGESPIPGGSHTMGDLAGDVVDLLDRLEIANAVVAACSMGGYVAFELWKAAPGYVSGLVLASTRAGADTEEGKAGRRKMIELVSSEGVDAVAQQMIPKLLGATTQREKPDVVAHVGNLIRGNGRDGVRGAIEAMMNRRDFTAHLDAMKVPTVIVAGGEDTLIPPASAGEMQRAIPGATAEVLPAVGHLPNLESPDRFHALLKAFLEKL